MTQKSIEAIKILGMLLYEKLQKNACRRKMFVVTCGNWRQVGQRCSKERFKFLITFGFLQGAFYGAIQKIRDTQRGVDSVTK